MAWLLAGTLQRLLVGVAPTDPLTAAVAVVSLAVVGFAASLIPSWRAARIDPVTVLRRG